MLCEYGCSKEATHQFKNGKWCCSEKWQSCSSHIEGLSETMKGEGNPMYGKIQSKIARDKISEKGKGRKAWNKGRNDYLTTEALIKMGNGRKGKAPWNKGKENREAKRTIEKINKKYPFFSRIEEMRYNPDKPDEKEIQVHCKNHLCKNSKEKGGWFNPIGRQLEWRISALEKAGLDNTYFYCSQECKDTCILYNLQSDPYKDTELPYTPGELQTWRIKVKELDNNQCQMCGSTENIHIHHIIPVKLEPFFALDPSNGICLCDECHFKYGHKDECSTGNLAQIIC